MDYRERLAKAKSLFTEARAILENEKATAEDKAKVPKMLEDAKALKAEAAQLKDIMESGVDELLKQVEDKQKNDKETGSSGEFKEWGDFLQAAFRAGSPRYKGPPDPRLVWFEDEKAAGHEQKDMVENVGASGGFLVPTEQMNELQGVLGENAIVRPRATIIRMRRRQISLPVLDQTATTSGIPHWFGGLQFYWAEEGAEKTESDASFREVTLSAHKLIGYTRASDELVSDAAISLGDFLAGPMGFGGGVRWMEDYAFLHGTGAGQPLGVVNAGATITVNRAATNAIGYADLCNMLESFLPSGRGVWIITQSALSDLVQMSGPTGNASYIWGSAVEGAPNRLLGLPVIWSEKASALGTAGDVILADFNYYLLGDRQATTVESTQYDYWRYDKTSWRVVHRVDGQPWLSAPLTYQDGSTQVSPFVILGDKST